MQTSGGVRKYRFLYRVPSIVLLQYKPYKFVILEALAATGLRSIRYAKEIPLVR